MECEQRLPNAIGAIARHLGSHNPKVLAGTAQLDIQKIYSVLAHPNMLAYVPRRLRAFTTVEPWLSYK